MPKRDVDLKSPSQRLGSAGTLALYGMTAGGEGSLEFSYSKAWVWLSASMLLPHAGRDAGRAKSNVLSGAFWIGGEGALSLTTSMLFCAQTHSAQSISEGGEESIGEEEVLRGPPTLTRDVGLSRCMLTAVSAGRSRV